jgi:hypothetical protein
MVINILENTINIASHWHMEKFDNSHLKFNKLKYWLPESFFWLFLYALLHASLYASRQAVTQAHLAYNGF